MKKIITGILLLILSSKSFSQEEINYFFGDTIIEFNQLKFDFRGAMSYKDRFKSPVYITNFTDSFKIITPLDFQIIKDGGYKMAITNKTQIVIAPKSTQKYRITNEGTNFKTNILRFSITNIQTTSKVEMIYAIKEIILDKTLHDQLENDVFLNNKIGPLELTLKAFEYKAKGTVSVTFKVKYFSENFLAIYAKKIKLIDSNGKVYTNHKTGPIYYRKEKRETNLTLEFENPYGVSKEFKADKLIFEDVFQEYAINKNSDTKEFILIKKGEGKGNPPKDDKEKDIEVIED